MFRRVPRAEAVAASASVAISLLLLGAKLLAYYITGSSAIFSDALEAIVNVVAALFAAYSLMLAHEPADAQHPYGHGKIEFMSAGFEGGMILLAMLVIVARAIESLLRGPEIARIDAGLILIATAGLVNGLAGLYLLRAGRRHESPTLHADGHHLLSDAVTSAGVLIALLIIRWRPGWVYVDPIAALLVAAYLGWTAWKLLETSAAGLMDKQDMQDQRLLRQILDSHLPGGDIEPKICSYHKLRHRHSGRFHWVDFHIVVPADWDIAHGHEVASAIEFEIEKALREGNATAHVEPCMAADCAACRPAT